MREWMHVADLAASKTNTGRLVAQPAAGLPFVLEPGMEVAFVPPRHDVVRRARVSEMREDARGRCTVAFEGVDAAAAAGLAGMRVLARRADVPEQVLHSTAAGLSGWEVRDEALGRIGEVADVQDAPGQTLLVVARDDGAEPALVPLVDAFVVGFDERARRIDMSLPAGLLDL